MKITDAEVIKTGEQELIDGITADLDWGAIEVLFKKEHGLGIDEDVEYKRGDIVVHNGQIAYQLNFEVKVTISVLLDREGNYIAVDASQDEDRALTEERDPSPQEKFAGIPSSGGDSPDRDPYPPLDEEALPLERINQSASRAGEMMEELAE